MYEDIDKLLETLIRNNCVGIDDVIYTITLHRVLV
jgi:hypothetical protein